MEHGSEMAFSHPPETIFTQKAVVVHSRQKMLELLLTISTFYDVLTLQVITNSSSFRKDESIEYSIHLIVNHFRFLRRAFDQLFCTCAGLVLTARPANTTRARSSTSVQYYTKCTRIYYRLKVYLISLALRLVCRFIFVVCELNRAIVRYLTYNVRPVQRVYTIALFTS